MIKTFNKRKFVNKYTIIFFWIISWVSLNVSQENLQLDFYRDYPAIDLIKFIRSWTSIIFSPIIYLLIIFKFKFSNKNNNIITFKIFAIYYFLQSISLVLNTENYSNLFWANLIFFNVGIFLLLNFKDNSKLDYSLYYIGIFFLLIIFIIYFIKNFNVFLTTNAISFYSYYSELKINNLENVPPRSSGLARTSTLLIIFLTSYYFLKKKNIFTYVGIKILACTIILTQSRIVIFSYLLLIIFFFHKSLNIKDRFKILFLYLIFPLAIVIITIYLKTFIHQHNNAESINLNVERIYNRNPDQTIYASTRYKDWNDIIEKTKKNYFLGYGIQADRLLINQSASNAFVYSFASGGVCGLLIFIIIYVRTFLISSILLSKYKTIKINRDFVLLSAVITNLFLLIRSFVENSFAVYGIDFLIFLICSIICEKKYKK
jgi:hypothetical protein